MPFSSYTKGPFIYRRSYIPESPSGISFTATPPSVENLDGSLTLNSITETPFMRHNGIDPTLTNWVPWTYGETINYQASSSTIRPSLNAGSPLLGTLDDSIKFNKGDYYKAQNTTYCDISTEDIVLEIIFKMPVDTGNNYFMGKNADATSVGWYFYTLSGFPYLSIRDATGSQSTTTTLSLTSNAYYHAFICIDRDSNWNFCVNGVSAGTGAASKVLTLTNATEFTIGTAAGASVSYALQSNIVYAAMWKHAAWFPGGAGNHTIWAAAAAERFAKLTATYLFNGLGTQLPTAATRNSIASLEKYETDRTKIYVVGKNWIRGSHKKDLATADIKGFHLETAHTNEAIRSENFGAVTSLACELMENRIDGPRDWLDQILVDGDMETAGVANWTVGNTCVPTKSTASPYEGAQALRLTYGATATDWVYQNVLPRNCTMYITGYCRGNGTANPRITSRSSVVQQSLLFTGTSSTDWQPFSVSVAQTGDYFRLCFGFENAGAGDWVEYDSIIVTPQVGMTGIIPNTDDTLHAVNTSYSATAGGVILSAFAKAGGKNWAVLYTNISDVYGYFNLSTGAAGTMGIAVTDYGIEPYGNGIYRIWIKYTTATTTVLYGFGPALADDDADYAGDGIDIDAYLFGWQIQEGDDSICNYIPTTSSAVSTVADALKYKGDDGNLGIIERVGSCTATILFPKTASLNDDRYIFSLSDGGAGADNITNIVEFTASHIELSTSASDGNSGYSIAAQATNDGNKHTVISHWMLDDVETTADATTGSQDVDCNPPNDIDEIYIGADRSGTQQINGIVADIKFYNEII